MNLKVGDQVCLKAPLPYLKTADPMPMLRPADLVSSEEIGEIVGLNGVETVKVRFRRGTFIIPIEHLSKRSLEGGEHLS